MTPYLDTCRTCGRTFEAHSAKARYCTGACRAKAARLREEARAAAVSALLRQTASAILGGAPSGVLHGLARNASKLLGER